jgi:murein DD-endopeptidase
VNERTAVISARPAATQTIRAPRQASGIHRVLLAALLAIAAALPVSVALATSARAATGSGQQRRPAGIPRRLRLDAWNFARRQRGKPYQWGGVGPRSYDCSGLVWAAYRQAGIVLPRTTFEMLDSHVLIRISWRQARRGDLAFFGREHVELFRYGNWTFGAEHTGTRIGFHKMNRFWHPTMYFRVR